ncbi:MAG: tRNA pseudouridine(38-40) synthase TruA [FCB group bacterium]|nr:tRNA pseudouridine(38-40) synthase TruA [FCB group bacterium]
MRYKIILQYDGSRFYGWQLQKKERTVQGVLEDILRKLNTGNRVAVTGAGRTDTGVHAWGQTAHFDLDTRLGDEELFQALNGNCPRDLRIRSLERVPDSFHARFSARSRSYRYQCYRGERLWLRNQSWICGNLEVEILNQAAERILGIHDFTSFSRQSTPKEHYRCDILISCWREEGEFVNFHITANRFLHHMVRYLVGTMVAVSQEKLSMTAFQQLLNDPQSRVHVFKAPPQGLILEAVDYA